MSDKQTGGSAFPLMLGAGGGFSLGMTLRDYFAAKAMQARLSSGFNEDADSSSFEATIAYQIADAMLKERDK